MIGPRHCFRLTAAFSLAVLGAVLLFGQTVEAQEPTAPVTEERTPLTRAELEELAGPIALYPDDLVSILLPASTYPLQIVQAARYLEEHKTNTGLKPNENWDDSVVALLNYPEVIELMNADLDWTSELGEAAIYQQTELLDAIQAFRDRAYAAGNLQSDERQVVTKKAETIVIEPADRKVIYVPYYEPRDVIVYQPYPVYHYYPRAYPVYYYPYPYGYSFGLSYFWGVTLAFSIDWHSHYVNVRHHRHYSHPYYGHYYHYPLYRRHSVSVSYRGNIWRPRHYSGARQRHTASVRKANRRLHATSAKRERHRTHNDRRLRRSGVNTGKRVSRSDTAAHWRKKPALSTRQVTRPRKHSTRSSKTITRRADTAARWRKQPALSTRQVTKQRSQPTRSSKTITRRADTAARWRKKPALNTRPVTRRRNQPTQSSGKFKRSSETIARTRKTVPMTALATRRDTQPSRTRTQPMRTFKDTRSKQSSSSQSRRSTVSKQNRAHPRARGRSVPRHVGRRPSEASRPAARPAHDRARVEASDRALAPV
jgi:hypothetical protein